MQRTDTALASQDVHLPEGLLYLKDSLSSKLSIIIEEIQHISNHEDALPIQHIKTCMENIKQLRLEILTSLIKHPAHEELQDEATTEIILFSQRLYQIVKKLL